MTIRELLAEGRAILSQSKTPESNPALDSALLLREILNCSKETLIVNGEKKVTVTEMEQYRTLLQRRISGECTAYILGRKEFMGLEFFVSPAVLVPRPETETLVEAGLKAGDETAAKKTTPVHLLDLCTGSGAIAISLKHLRSEWEIFASDISAASLAVARQNAEKLLPQPARSPENKVTFIESDLFSNIEGSFDLIVSNPPYIAVDEMSNLPPEVKNEPAIALNGGKDGLDIITQIIEEAPDFLNPGGILLIEADPRQMEKIEEILNENGFSGIEVINDLSGQKRVITGVYPE